MKIFVSWSGDYSHGVAVALKDWLPLIFNPISVFVSSESIRKGKRWPQEIAKELETTNYGIACLTHDNLAAPWLLFETGALSKLPEGSVSTLLLGGLAPADVGSSPLSHFQHTTFEREDFYKLITTINDAQGDTKRTETNLKTLFTKFWDDLSKLVTQAASKREKKPEPARTAEDMLRELLDVTNNIARNMPQKYNPDWLPQVRIQPTPKGPPLTALGISAELQVKLVNSGFTDCYQLLPLAPSDLAELASLRIGEMREIQKGLNTVIGNHDLPYDWRSLSSLHKNIAPPRNSLPQV